MSLKALAGIALLLAGLAPGADQDLTPAVYGYVRHVVIEAGTGAPARIQVWGTLCVAGPGADDYFAPARGYLYFDMPSGRDADVAREEWFALKSLADTGGPWPGGSYYGIVSFGRRGAALRLRTSDEKPENPDAYRAGGGVKQVQYGAGPPVVFVLGQLPKPASTSNYVLVENVRFESGPDAPDRIEIQGVFAMGEPNDYSYAPPRRAVAYFSLPPWDSNPETTRTEWRAWAASAEKKEVVGFFTFADPRLRMRLRSPDATLDAPDPYPISRDRSGLKLDVNYTPVRKLLELR